MQTLDVVDESQSLYVVMEYTSGETASRLARLAIERNEWVPLPVAARILLDVLRGLHAAHEATNENGEPLCIVHRDVSPQNILVGDDGSARVLDFGVAKASQRSTSTKDG